MASVARNALMAALLAGASLLSGCSTFEAASLEPETVFATTQSNRLVRFSAGAPARLASGRSISGMQPGEQVAGLDFRPANGRLYALGTAGQLYVVDPVTAMAQPVGPGGLRTLVMDEVGFAFDPATDRIRMVTVAGYNLRLDPDTGLLVDGDPAAAGLQSDAPLDYGPTEFEHGLAPRLAGVAIVHLPASGARPAFTTQYAIDRSTRTLVTQGALEHTHPRPPLQSGQLFTVGRLAIDLGDGPLSFDAKDPRLALLCVSRGVRSELYRVDLRTAAVEPLGRIALDEPVTAIAMAPRLRGGGTAAAAATATATKTTTAAAAAGTR
ncbi:MAG: DUF4394 domain-containing protein [Pseudomonadota bacterium]